MYFGLCSCANWIWFLDLVSICEIMASQIRSKIDFHAYLHKYCADLVQIWHEYTLVGASFSNVMGDHASMNMHILISLLIYED
jgi:hypothetical protein